MTLQRFSTLFTKTTYPSGETHLRQVGTSTGLPILATTYTFGDLCDVICAHRTLVRQGWRPEWFLPYFPFARDDRRNNVRDAFELGLALELVRELDPVVVDPHSDVAGQLRHIPQRAVVDLYRRQGQFTDDMLVLIPDLGASKKAYTWMEKNEWLQCTKRRDPATGNLSGFEILGDPERIRGRKCIVIDDICDGGGTFIGLAQEALKYAPASLTLAVSHGLFTKGRDVLLAHFDQLLTPDYDTLYTERSFV